MGKKSNQKRRWRESAKQTAEVWLKGRKDATPAALKDRLESQVEAAFPAVQVKNAALTVEVPAYRIVTFGLKAVFAYPGVRATRLLNSQIQFQSSLAGDELEMELDRRFPRCLEEMAQKMLADLPADVGPKGPEDIQFAGHFQGVTSVPETLQCGESSVKDVFVRIAGELTQDLGECLREEANQILQEKQEAETPEPWLIPGKVEQCIPRFRLVKYQVSMDCELSIRYLKTKNETCSSEGPGIYEAARTKDLPAFEAYLRKAMTDKARRAVKKAAQALPAFQVIPPGEGEPEKQFPLPVWNSLKERGTVGGEVMLNYKQEYPAPNGTSVFFAYFGNNRYRFLSDSLLVEKRSKNLEMDVPGFLKQEADLKQVLEQTELPVQFNFCERILFADAVSLAWTSFPLGEGQTRPKIHFNMVKGELKEVVWRGVSYSAKTWFDPEKTLPLKQRVEELFHWLLEAEKKLGTEPAEQMRILSDLNPTQVEILRYVYRSGRTWFHDVADSIESRVITTKVAAGQYLYDLAEIRVPFMGKQVPVIYSKMVSGRHGDFQLYTPNTELPKELIASVRPRPFCGDEVQDMTTAGRDKWVMEQAGRAKTAEECWNVLEILENQLPKAAAVRFVRSPQGEDFFRKIQGADAEYARFFLESLPGCKSLAPKLIPSQEDAPESEEESGTES